MPHIIETTRDRAEPSRAVVFHESLSDAVRRNALGIAWGLKPNRVASFLPGLGFVLRQMAFGGRRLPDPDKALTQPDGLCGVLRNLDPQTLIQGYQRGLYPFAHVGPYKWWAPSERNVLFFDDFHMQKLIRRLLRGGRYTVTFDRAFDEVVAACTERRAGKHHLTWLRPPLMRAFSKLHGLGHAHSFEVWTADGELVGGGYGLAVGDVFFTESMFSRQSDTSKLGFAVLNFHLARWGFALNDVKTVAPTLQAQGCRQIPRAAFQDVLERRAMTPGKVGPWHVEVSLDQVAAWYPAKAKQVAAE